MAYRSFKRKFRRRVGRKFVKKTIGGHVKEFIDGKKGRYIRAGVNAIPYLIKSAALVKSMINTEMKIDDQNATIAGFTTAGTFTLLNGIAQGVGENQRIGKSILMKDLQVRFTVTNNTAGSTCVVSVIIVVDKQANGAAPTTAALLQSGAATLAPFSPINNDNTKRFVIARRWYYTLDQTYNFSKVMDCHVPLNIHTAYDNTGALAADISTNSLWLYIVSSTGANNPSFSYYTRLRFYDT